MNSISDGIVALNTDWCYTYVNKKAGELLGREPGSLIGKNIWTEFPEGVGLPFYKYYYKAFETQQKQEFQDYYEPFDRWYENRVYPSAKGLVIYFSDITEKNKAEALIVQKERILNVINDTLTQPLFILSVESDDTFRFISVSNSFLNALGVKEEDILNKYARDIIPEPSLSLALTNYEKAIGGKKTVHWEEATPYKTGLKTVIVTISPLFNEKGQCSHLVGIVYDITERKNAEARILENEKYLDNILNNIGDPIFVKDDESRLLLVNNAFCSIFGLSRNDVLGKTLAEDVSPEERDSFLKIDRQVIKTGIENVTEENLTVRGGETKIISTKKTRFVDKKGYKYLIGIIRDISERKKAELELKSAKEYSEGLIASMHEGLVVFNKKTEITDVNPAFCEMSGFSEDELLGRDCPFPFSPPEIEDEAYLRHQQIIRGEELDSYETVYMRRDGSRFNVEVTISGIKNSDGQIEVYFGTVTDTTERKKAELKLKQAKEFTDKLVMSMQEGLIIVDLEGKIMEVNDSTCRILGFSRKELIGQNVPYPFSRPEDAEQIVNTIQKITAGMSLSVQFEFIRKNGERFPASFLTGNITDDKGDVIAVFGTMKDISEEARAQRILEENAIRSTKKKDVILKLAGLVGKDFKSSLHQITKLASETLNIERVSIWSFNTVKSEIRCEDLYLQSSNSHTDGAILAKVDNPEYFEALEKNRTILINDALKNKVTEKFARDYLVPNKIKSMMDVFIHGTNGHYGILCFEHVVESHRNWSAAEQEFATSIASIVSLMVESSERTSAENRLIQTNEELFKANSELKELRNKLEQENIYLRNELDLVFNFEEMVYGSAEFGNVLSEIEKVAGTNATVLLLGETGTGKELLARAIHNISLRNNKPLIKVNCSAIPRELIESELFGHKKGSFTGAFANKIGKFELADGGTLFLDEIGELPLDMQPKILRFLQHGEIEVVGGTGIKKVDVRVIAATNRNLKEEIEKKRFREDLFFRLNVFPIQVPPLRKRKGDIPLLVEHFMDKFNKAYSKNIKYVADAAMEKLMSYDWPGNIRELENLIERATILSDGETLIIPGFESESQKSRFPENSTNLSLEAIQRNHIIRVLEKCHWKISGPDSASTLLDLKPSTLRDKMSKLGIKK